MTDIRKQLLAAFDAEHREHLQAIRSALDHADRGEIDLTDVFRRAHSLKGAARAVDLPAVEEVAHQLEALFSQVLEGQQSLDAPTVATVRQNLDLIEDLVADVVEAAGAETPGAQPVPASTPRIRRTGTSSSESRCDRTAGAGSYLRVAAEQMEELSDSMHRLLTELQADEGIDDTLRQIELEIRGLRRSWDQLHAQVNALGSAARQESNAAAMRSGGSFAPRLRDFDQGLKALFRRLSALSRDRRQSRWSIEQAARQVRDNIDRVSLVSAETVFGGFGHMVREIAREGGTGRACAQHRPRHPGRPAGAPGAQGSRDASPAQRGEPRGGATGGTGRQGQAGAGRGHPGARLPRRAPRHQHPRRRARARISRRIEQVAIERGLLQPRSPDHPPPMMDQLLALVFTPGFSTAGEVDRLSGRGIGSFRRGGSRPQAAGSAFCCGRAILTGPRFC